MPLGRLVAILYLEALAGAAPAPELDRYGVRRKVTRAAGELGDVEGLRHAAGGTADGELPGGVHADVLPSFTVGVESLPPPCDLPASLSTPPDGGKGGVRPSLAQTGPCSFPKEYRPRDRCSEYLASLVR